MGNRESISKIKFINKSDLPKVEVTVGNETKCLQLNGICKFEIGGPSPAIIRAYDKSGRLIHELTMTLGHIAASQVWKITNSGVKRKKSPFFTLTHYWARSNSVVSISSRRSVP